MKFNLLFTAGMLLFWIIFSCSSNGIQKGAEGEKKASTSSSGDLTNELDSMSYIVGMTIGQNLKNDGITELNSDLFVKALNDVMGGKDPLIEKEASTAFIQSYFQKAQKRLADANLEKGKKFLEDNKGKDGVTTLESGMQYIVMKEGTGPKPSSTDQVKTHYHGTLVDGSVFDSSVDRGEPAMFPVNRVIPGWTEALQLMPVGSKWKLFIPSDLAYGERGSPGGIGPNETLIFEVELLEIVDTNK